MHNVFKGIVIGVLGFIIWFTVSVVYGVGLGLGAPDNPQLDFFLNLGFFIMVGGPIVYIVVIPVVNYLKRRRKRADRP